MRGGGVQFHANNLSRAGHVVNGISRTMEIRIAAADKLMERLATTKPEPRKPLGPRKLAFGLDVWRARAAVRAGAFFIHPRFKIGRFLD
jgi:hypothetical protein